jgi:predicted nucleic acid-binding protein
MAHATKVDADADRYRCIDLAPARVSKGYAAAGSATEADNLSDYLVGIVARFSEPGGMETLALSHDLRLGDALIAATAIEHGLTVLTANTKHFTPSKGCRLSALN